ncbi:MAG: hypothetical protein NHF89_00545 [Candidatus Shikimatogenerans bostrichidophilus]|nr:MAG: hypothetical protein NHF89_00545 [Candidatus Shikimatogenerans bostrichidophilus]
MNNNNLINSFINYKNIKNIDIKKMLLIIKKSILEILNKNKELKYNIYINFNKCNFIIKKVYLVVNNYNLKNKYNQILYYKAKKKFYNCKVGDLIEKKIKLKNLNRKKIFFIKKNINKNIYNKLNKNKYKKYIKIKGKIIRVEIINIFKKYLIVKDKYNNELFYFFDYKDINKKFFIIGNFYFFLIKNVFLDIKLYKTIILLSRNDNLFIENLLKKEIPEILDGIIVIIKIVRIPGIKTKIVLYSNDKNIDAIGSCIGIKGSRINNILKELDKEKIDLIEYSKDFNLYINRLFNNIKIFNIKIEEKNKKIKLFLNKSDISKVIGKNGNNIRLCSLLLNYKIIINSI